MRAPLALALVFAPTLVFAQSADAPHTDSAPATTPAPRGPGDEQTASDQEPYADAPGSTPVHEPTRSTADSPDQRIHLSGFLRTRADLAHNWDLGRGPTPSMRALWPTPYAGPSPGHTQTNLDMRLRLDVAIEVGWGVSVRGRIHALDNLRYGSTPEGDFSGGTVNQRGTDRPPRSQAALRAGAVALRHAHRGSHGRARRLGHGVLRELGQRHRRRLR